LSLYSTLENSLISTHHTLGAKVTLGAKPLQPQHLNIMLIYTISMKKNFWLWAFGDVFTKIAGGIFGGSVVALYYNEFVLTQGKTIELLSLFWILTILSIPLAILGYVMIQKAEAN